MPTVAGAESAAGQSLLRPLNKREAGHARTVPAVHRFPAALAIGVAALPERDVRHHQFIFGRAMRALEDRHGQLSICSQADKTRAAAGHARRSSHASAASPLLKARATRCALVRTTTAQHLALAGNAAPASVRFLKSGCGGIGATTWCALSPVKSRIMSQLRTPPSTVWPLAFATRECARTLGAERQALGTNAPRATCFVITMPPHWMQPHCSNNNRRNCHE
jgi:hypothetical protein